MRETVTVFASFVPKPRLEDKAEVILQGMVGPTRAELGCERYNLYRIKAGNASLHLFKTL